jgi:[ribosomal protein S5]-alanine N-acetyltransferase
MPADILQKRAEQAIEAGRSPSGVVIETARLRLRAHRDDDLAAMLRLIGTWEVARWVSNVPYPYTEADGRWWIASVRVEHACGDPRRFAVALRDTDCIIGGIGLDGDPGEDGSDEAALGYWFGEPYWGKGYGREAAAAIIRYGFRRLGLAAIRAYTDPANLRSQKLLLHCGLALAGEIELSKPTRNGAARAPLFRISQPARGGSP